jgi:long-chain acyl-CoA synthetase
MGGFVACPIVPSLRDETIAENLAEVKPALVLHDAPKVSSFKAPTPPEQTLDIDGEVPFLIMFSSGSTGKNKAICHCINAVGGSAAAFATLSSFSSGTKLYHVLPMTYMAGFMNAMLSVFMAGGKIIEGPQFSLETVADFWSRPLATDANTLSVIPPLAAAVCRLTRDIEKIENVRDQFVQVQCTSQAIQSDLRRKFLQKFSLPLQDCYGMTELGGPLTLQSREDAILLNNCSQPLPDLNLEIREDGELWINSPFSMLGYLVDGEFTDPFDNQGYLNTGDLATRTGDKIEITGRVKDIIIRGGINTSPARIESTMSEFPEVEEVAVVGLPHDFWGEEIVACIVSRGATSTEAEAGILSLCKSHLDTHEIPDRVIFMDAFPRSFIGKVLKNELVAGLTEQQ